MGAVKTVVTQEQLLAARSKPQAPKAARGAQSEVTAMVDEEGDMVIRIRLGQPELASFTTRDGKQLACNRFVDNFQRIQVVHPVLGRLVAKLAVTDGWTQL